MNVHRSSFMTDGTKPIVIGEQREQQVVLPFAVDPQIAPGIAFALEPEFSQQTLAGQI